MTRPTPQDRAKDERKHDFFILYNVVIDQYMAKIGTSAFGLYCTLLRMADEQHECWPGLAYLEKLTGMSKNTLLKAIAVLVEHKMIRVEAQEKRASNLYIILDLPKQPSSGSFSEPPSGKRSKFEHNDEGGAENEPPATEVVQKLHRGGAKNEPKVVQNLNRGGSFFAPDVVQKMNTNNTNPNKTQEQDTTEEDTTTILARTQARAQPEALVVVFSANTIPDSDSAKPIKANTSGMMPLVDMLPPVSPSGVHPKEMTPPSEAVAALMEQGVKPLTTAKRLVEKHGEQACLERIAALPFCKYDEAGGYLVAALDKNYDLPMKYLAKREDEARKRKRQADLASAEDRKVQAAETVRREREEAERRWDALTLAEQDKLEDVARAEIAERYKGDAGKKWLDTFMGRQELHFRCLELVMRPVDNTKNTMDKAA